MPNIDAVQFAGGEAAQTEKLRMTTAEIGLSLRTTNCLDERRVFTVQDLLNCTRDDLLGIDGFGEKTLEEISKALERAGLPMRSGSSRPGTSS